jgi:hypothetical protein
MPVDDEGIDTRVDVVHGKRQRTIVAHADGGSGSGDFRTGFGDRSASGCFQPDDAGPRVRASSNLAMSAEASDRFDAMPAAEALGFGKMARLLPRNSGAGRGLDSIPGRRHRGHPLEGSSHKQASTGPGASFVVGSRVAKR